MKKVISLFLASAIMFSLALPSFAATTPQFSDVPDTSFAYQDILTLKELGVTNGMGDGTYGLYSNFKRCDFVLMLGRLMKWDMSATTSPFADVAAEHYAIGAISQAAKLGVYPAENGNFYPEALITREDMAVMLTRALGYSDLAAQKTSLTPFTDVSSASGSYGALVMAYNFGIITGTTQDYPTQFNPSGVATREQAAAMMMRCYRRAYEKPKSLHAFYAISSWGQKDYVNSTDEISVGWGRMEFDAATGVKLNMTSSGGNEWSVPSGSQDLLALAKVPVMLDIYMDMSNSPLAMLQSPAYRAQAVQQIADALEANSAYSGVTIDFEGFISADFAPLFTAFLTELNAKIGDKLLYCAVPPNDYYKGYDYRAIGEVCDKVILMAHDYNATTLPDYMLSKGLPATPVAPIASVYNSLAQITNPKTGVADKSKIMLAVSFTTARWEAVGGTVTHTSVKKSDYAAIDARIASGATYSFNTEYQSPSITYHDATDNTDNIVWYENAQSIAAKTKLAQMFGIGGVSVWRLGIIPDSCWQTLQDSVS